MTTSINNSRICKFLLITSFVVFLIFVYASYSSLTTGNTPHMRPPSALVYSPASLKHNNKEANNSQTWLDLARNTLNSIGTKHQQHQHRVPTIDIDAQNDEAGNTDQALGAAAAPTDILLEDTAALGLMSNNNLLEEQYLQAVDNGITNTTNTKNQNSDVIQVIENNKIPDSELLIPTSNLQKFIENADKVLDTISAPKATLNATTVIKPPAPKVAVKATAIKPAKKQAGDPTTGIPTHELYEGGHVQNEISNENICPNAGEELKLLILIMSAPTHKEARLAIRQTWGHFGMRRDVSTAFVIGRSENDTLNKVLSEENFVYGDLIRGNSIDSYNNLTLKTISSLEWVDLYCPHTKYILKTDDDMFINVPKLLSFLDAHAKEKRVIFGRLAKKWKPIRNPKSKYFVSTGQFSQALYPPFTTGPAYVLTSDIVHELFERSLQQLYLKLEDVYTTGVIAQQLNIKRVHVNEFLNRRIGFNACSIRKTISVHMIKANEQYDLWKKLLDQSTKCK